MIGQTIGHYQILDRLGSGGMGVVYKALDQKLGRFVAIKFLPPGMNEEQRARSRFVQEARAASALDHPNICTIYSVDETPEGQIFIVMSYYDGETLHRRLHAGRLTYADVVAIARQVGDGLAQAHSLGIVHRDIKPANIMISGGLVKILDFGLARHGASSGLTKEGSAIGTVAYMSPEMAQGFPTDHRSDIWSWGVVLFQMLSGGKLPFHGSSDIAMMRSIVDEEPRLDALEATIGPSFEPFLQRVFTKNIHYRFQEMNAALEALEEAAATAPGVNAATPVIRPIAASSVSRSASGTRESPSLAVLPFVNLTKNQEDEYFSDGLTEDIIYALTKFDGLRVTSRLSAFAFKNSGIALHKIGEKLNVRMALEGSIRRSGERLRVSVQLVNIADDRPLWSERFDRESADVFAIQDEIVGRIVQSLRVKLQTLSDAPIVKRYTENLQAYNFYLQGRYHYNRADPHSLMKALECFERAVALDSQYPLPYCGIAECYLSLGAFGLMEPRQAWDSVRKSALRAVELDETLAEARVSLAAVMCLNDLEWQSAEVEFRRAQELNPGYANAHFLYAVCCLEPQGRLDQAMAEMKRAEELDPLSMIIISTKAWNHYLRREYEQAKVEAEHALELDKFNINAMTILGAVLRELGDTQGSIELLERAKAAVPQATILHGTLGITKALIGDRAGALQMIEEMTQLASSLYVPPIYYAWIYGVLGENDKAFEWLDRSFEKRDFQLRYAGVSPGLDLLRTDPRFPELLRRMRLADVPEATRTLVAKPI